MSSLLVHRSSAAEHNLDQIHSMLQQPVVSSTKRTTISPLLPKLRLTSSPQFVSPKIMPPFLSLNLIGLTVTLLALANSKVALANSISLTDCSVGQQADAKLEQVRVSGCSTGPKGPCPLIRGQNASIEVDFLTSKSPIKH